MNIIYIGSSRPLSTIPFTAILNSEYNISAIAVNDNAESDFNVTTQGSLKSQALSNNIPVIQLNSLNEEEILQLKSYKPDIILVSCYAKRLPASILSLPKLGCFNIHPSLLPKFRGPDPLFWQFREGVDEFGVTLHRMSVDFDEGNIVAQQSISLADGLSRNEAIIKLTHTASELLLQFLNDMKNNAASETPQKHAQASYQSYPTSIDYSVSSSWAAQRIYNFINAYKGNGVYFTCEIEGKEYKLTRAISYQEESFTTMEVQALQVDGNKITIACNNSVIECEFEN